MTSKKEIRRAGRRPANSAKSARQARPASAPGSPAPPAPFKAPNQQESAERELSNAVIFFHEAVASRLGMGVAEWKCLGLLGQHGALTATQLAEASGFTSGAITGIVDRLERAGRARREPNPGDRRSIIVRPLELERFQKENVFPIFTELRREMMALASRYTPAELVAINSYFKGTTEILQRQTARLRNDREKSQ
jgi:DNA-binding MarR family transcriptional regulator